MWGHKFCTVRTSVASVWETLLATGEGERVVKVVLNSYAWQQGRGEGDMREQSDFEGKSPSLLTYSEFTILAFPA